MRYLSLFSGLECATVVLAPLGWSCVGVAEIRYESCEVLSHRLNASRPKYLPADINPRKYAHMRPFGTPGTLPNFGDVSQITNDDIACLGAIDVVIGGSPCQDLSVAGLQAGFDGDRSSLFFQLVRVFDAAHDLAGARFLWWENVVGALTNRGGRDFAIAIGALAGCEFAHVGGCGNEGVLLGPRGLVEWSVLDAQWLGVAQRRRRVFAVLDTGNWADRRPILLEPDRLRGFDEPSRKAWDEDAPSTTGGFAEGRVANALTAHRGQRNEIAECVNGYLIPSEDGVRRLTPRECERLMGLPDDWTCVPVGRKKHRVLSDAHRYVMIGDSFASVVIAWIARQIQSVAQPAHPAAVLM